MTAPSELPPLLQCPFCDGDATAYHYGALWWGLCEDCGAEGPVSDDANVAIERWNRRATPTGTPTDSAPAGEDA